MKRMGWILFGVVGLGVVLLSTCQVKRGPFAPKGDQVGQILEQHSLASQLEAPNCDPLVADWESLTSEPLDASHLRKLQDVAQKYRGIPDSTQMAWKLLIKENRPPGVPSFYDCQYGKFLAGARTVFTDSNRVLLKGNRKTDAQSTAFAHTVLSLVARVFQNPLDAEAFKGSVELIGQMGEGGWLTWRTPEEKQLWSTKLASFQGKTLAETENLRKELEPILKGMKAPH